MLACGTGADGAHDRVRTGDFAVLGADLADVAHALAHRLAALDMDDVRVMHDSVKCQVVRYAKSGQEGPPGQVQRSRQLRIT